MKVTALQRPGRAAAAVGGVLAVGAAGLMAVLAGTASAATAGTCTDNVNVRQEPRADAPIVAVCDRGTKVQVGETRNGFVKLENLKGWAVKQYVKTNDGAAATEPPADAGVAPARGAAVAGTGSTPRTTGTPAPSGTQAPANATPDQAEDGANADEATPAAQTPAQQTPAQQAPARSGGLAGLLGR
jgi:hypothetical protein